MQEYFIQEFIRRPKLDLKVSSAQHDPVRVGSVGHVASKEFLNCAYVSLAKMSEFNRFRVNVQSGQASKPMNDAGAIKSNVLPLHNVLGNQAKSGTPREK